MATNGRQGSRKPQQREAWRFCVVFVNVYVYVSTELEWRLVMSSEQPGSESSSFTVKLQEGKRWPKESTKAHYVLTSVLRAHSNSSTEDDNDVWCVAL